MPELLQLAQARSTPGHSTLMRAVRQRGLAGYGARASIRELGGSATARRHAASERVRMLRLLRRALRVGVGAEHAAIPSLWLEHLAAPRAAVEVLAGVLGHRFAPTGPTQRTGDRRVCHFKDATPRSARDSSTMPSVDTWPSQGCLAREAGFASVRRGDRTPPGPRTGPQVTRPLTAHALPPQREEVSATRTRSG